MGASVRTAADVKPAGATEVNSQAQVECIDSACKTLLPPNAKFCRKCGKKQEAEVTTPPPVAPTPATEPPAKASADGAPKDKPAEKASKQDEKAQQEKHVAPEVTNGAPKDKSAEKASKQDEKAQQEKNVALEVTNAEFIAQHILKKCDGMEGAQKFFTWLRDDRGRTIKGRTFTKEDVEEAKRMCKKHWRTIE